MGIASSGTAEPVAFLTKTNAKQTTDKFEVTAFGDITKTYVTGLPDYQATFSGFYDNATAQTYTAAVDGVARKFYLYPDVVGTPGQYWFGTAFFDFSLTLDVGGAVAIDGSLAAASAVSKVG